MGEKKDTAAANAVGKANADFKSYMMSKVDGVAASSGTQLSPRDKTFANDIILNTYKKMMEEGINPNEVNFIGCNFPGQVKRFARLGLSLNDKEIWLDIRNNTKAGKKDINIKIQYQGEEKLLSKFCKKNDGVKNIIKDVILDGEELVQKRDFKTGDYEIIDHKIQDILNRNIGFKNKDKVKGAYAVAYHNDGSQTAIIIDKDRIDRAMKAAKTAVIWQSDFKKMVLKTVVHELYQELAKFNVIPDELLKDYSEMVIDKDEVQSEINANANKEFIDADFVESEVSKGIENDAHPELRAAPEAVKESEPVIMANKKVEQSADPF